MLQLLMYQDGPWSGTSVVIQKFYLLIDRSVMDVSGFFNAIDFEFEQKVILNM